MRRRSLFFFLLTCLFMVSCHGMAADAYHGRQVVVLVIDRVGLADLDRSDLPNFSWCLRHGAVGLMNARTGAGIPTGFSGEHSYLTIGAARRGIGSPKTGEAFGATETLEGGTAAEVFWRNTGYRPRPENVVLPAIAEIVALNAVEDRSFRPGLLGDSLHGAGLLTCVLGNADTPEGPGRYAVALAMDGRGIVDLGEVGPGLLSPDPTWPFGLRTDYEALATAFKRYRSRAALLVVELGDTSRVDLYGPYLLPTREEALRHRALQAADAFLGVIRREIDPAQTLLVILTPTPGRRAQAQGYTLTPLVISGPGFSEGRLFSTTTKRAGIVTNTDVAPTILAFLGLPVPAEAAGRPLEGRPAADAFAALRTEEARLSTIAFWQQPVLKFFTVFLDTLFICCGLCLLWPELPWRRPLRGFLLLATGLPLALLLAPLPTDPRLFLPFFLGVLVVLYGCLFLLAGRSFSPLFFLYLGTVGAVLLDQFLGAPLAKRSPLSYSPLAGSRFYGLGNEYMGVLLGAALMGAGYAFERWRGQRWLLPGFLAFFVLLAFVLGAPGLGTNVGGFLAAAVGFGVAIPSFAEKKVAWRNLLLCLGAAFAFLVLLGVLDSLRPAASQTHLGRLVAAMRAGGLGPFWEVARRKLAMNLKLVRFSGWSRVVIFALLGMAVTAVFPSGRGLRTARAHPFLVKALWASLAAAAGAFIFNDSGIVAAGTLLIFPAASWFDLLLREEKSDR
ncbi:MAG: hypothetical protein ACUVRM_09165 [Bacillota bacterium]